MPNEDKINPNYYRGSAMADYVSDFDLNFDLGNVIKYVSRAGKKFGEKAVEDLEKAKWYLQHAIDRYRLELEKILNPTLKINLIFLLTKNPSRYRTWGTFFITNRLLYILIRRLSLIAEVLYSLRRSDTKTIA